MLKQTLILAACALIALPACKKGSNNTPSQSSVMFINAISTTSSLLTISGQDNNAAITSAANIKPLAYSPYVDVNSQSSVSYAPFAGGTAVGSVSSVGTNGHYSFFAYGPVGTLQTVLAADDLIIPAAGMAKVRIANFCSANPKLAAYFNGVKLDTMVAYGSVDPFTEVAAGTGMLLVHDPAQPAYSASIASQAFLAGKFYTVMFTDTAANGTSGFRITVVNTY